MKKLALILLLGISSFIFADHDYEGVIEAIDNEQKTLQVNGQIIKVLPNTKIEEDSCYLPWDINKKFVDLKVGDIVEIEVFLSNNILVAGKIEIQCVKNRAY
ncbi:hypothetical protein CQA62_02230 [Helicobacter cholecystus]|uniref:DUF5666 domain-containing protein n=1 Tax=Helicobacter cholecystus TaxID=45498 RepID=A0A3D8IW52_9HELI|nr:DUF5666 domain-containing protein [Helicobacter cholecystus]RDU69488.1 hypothetical protein CQA62_02230 [Helicobacter cholecystus]VEJ24039.1 Uncharacterised protein [Helicobacter cholecystus]